MDEEVVVAYIVPFFVTRNNHEAANGSDERDDTLLDYLLNVRSGDEGSEKLNKLESHALNSIGLFFILTFIASEVFLFFIVTFFESSKAHTITQYLSENWQMEIQ